VEIEREGWKIRRVGSVGYQGPALGQSTNDDNDMILSECCY